MADYRATGTEFTAVADAIRTKGGTSAQLTWPNGFVSAVQAIPTGSGVVQPLSVTQNGTYNPPSGVDGYAPVTVNVSGGGGDEWTTLKNYIESSGTQYINTEYVPNANSYIEVVANVPDNATSYPAIYGARSSTNDEAVIFAEFNISGIAMVWATGDTAFQPLFWNNGYIGKKCNYIMGGNGIVSIYDIDGFGFKGTRSVGTVVNLPLYIFVLNQNNSPVSVTFCTMKFYRMRVYESDVLIHEFIPWQENGVACLKDTVTENLFYNAGTGDFVYGTDS